ncbi:MAG: hypothetical protein K8S23_03235 [Candidatus Cloacimonetes bacterium]|nr:hypothetical protein [Candidatus Cloacimonadota bacterium]
MLTSLINPDLSGKNLLLLILLFISIGLFADGVQPTGAGTSGDPYQIATLDNLLWVSTNDTSWDSYFLQTADIDAADTQNWNSGAGFSPIGNNSTRFSGEYDGSGYIISNLHINHPSTNYIGFFGYVYTGEVTNLGIENADIIGIDYVGGLVGRNTSSSSVNNSYSTGSVNGHDHVGGLMGRNSSSSSVNNSYSKGSVYEYNNIGGLVGYNNSSISNCYSTGSVSGSNYVGGLVGIDTFTSSVNNSFWDTETSNQDTSEGGTGKTTAEMKTLSTFTDAGWDFIDETINGTDDDWEILVQYNSGYPFLSWETDLVVY